MKQAEVIPDGPWKGKVWESWFANFNPTTGAVDPPPFDPATAFWPDAAMMQWGVRVPINSAGKTGFMQGAAWASMELATQVAQLFRGAVVDGAPKFLGGVSFLQPQLLVRIFDENGGYLDFNPGEIARYFINKAGPPGRSAEYINAWLCSVTAFTAGNFVPGSAG